MKAAFLVGERKIVLKDVPKPAPREDEVLIRVAYTGICGSDLSVYRRGFGDGVERIMGHEFSGDIAEVGANVKGWNVGDRVVVAPSVVCWECFWCKRGEFELCPKLGFIGLATDGAFAEFVKVPAYTLHKLPDEVTYFQGALIEPLATALHGIRLSEMKDGANVVVTGAGPIGLCVMVCVKALFGVAAVYAGEILEPRIELAKQIADEVFNPEEVDLVEEIEARTGGIGADIVFECSGSLAAEEQAMKLVRRGGKIVFIGVGHEPFKIAPSDLTRKEPQLYGCLAYSSLNGEGEFKDLIGFIKRGVIKPDFMVTSVISLDDIDEKGFKMAASEAGKSLVKLYSAR